MYVCVFSFLGLINKYKTDSRDTISHSIVAVIYDTYYLTATASLMRGEECQNSPSNCTHEDAVFANKYSRVKVKNCDNAYRGGMQQNQLINNT